MNKSTQTKPPFNGLKKYLDNPVHPMSQFKAFMLNINSFNLVHASEIEEFFYEKNEEAVEEGEVVGIEIENEDTVDIVLFSDIYFSQQNF